MPIDRKHFESGIDDTMDKVLKIFVDNPEKAFTPDEVRKATNLSPTYALYVLTTLRSRGFLESKIIGLKLYFILARD